MITHPQRSKEVQWRASPCTCGSDVDPEPRRMQLGQKMQQWHSTDGGACTMQLGYLKMRLQLLKIATLQQSGDESLMACNNG